MALPHRLLNVRENFFGESPPPLPPKVMDTRVHLRYLPTYFAAVSLFLCHVVDYLIPNTYLTYLDIFNYYRS